MSKIDKIPGNIEKTNKNEESSKILKLIFGFSTAIMLLTGDVSAENNLDTNLTNSSKNIKLGGKFLNKTETNLAKENKIFYKDIKNNEKISEQIKIISTILDRIDQKFEFWGLRKSNKEDIIKDFLGNLDIQLEKLFKSFSGIKFNESTIKKEEILLELTEFLIEIKNELDKNIKPKISEDDSIKKLDIITVKIENLSGEQLEKYKEKLIKEVIGLIKDTKYIVEFGIYYEEIDKLWTNKRIGEVKNYNFYRLIALRTNLEKSRGQKYISEESWNEFKKGRKLELKRQVEIEAENEKEQITLDTEIIPDIETTVDSEVISDEKITLREKRQVEIEAENEKELDRKKAEIEKVKKEGKKDILETVNLETKKSKEEKVSSNTEKLKEDLIHPTVKEIEDYNIKTKKYFVDNSKKDISESYIKKNIVKPKEAKTSIKSKLKKLKSNPNINIKKYITWNKNNFTESGVELIQERLGVKVDGKFGPKTLVKLEKICGYKKIGLSALKKLGLIDYKFRAINGFKKFMLSSSSKLSKVIIFEN